MSDKKWTADTWYLQLYDNYTIVKDIELTIDGDAKDFCNQARSFYWFRQRERGVLHYSPRPRDHGKFQPPHRRFVCNVRLREDSMLEFELNLRDQLPKVIQHTNVWELYKDIGYDHRRKRYLEPSDE